MKVALKKLSLIRTCVIILMLFFLFRPLYMFVSSYKLTYSVTGSLTKFAYEQKRLPFSWNEFESWKPGWNVKWLSENYDLPWGAEITIARTSSQLPTNVPIILTIKNRYVDDKEIYFNSMFKSAGIVLFAQSSNELVRHGEIPDVKPSE